MTSIAAIVCGHTIDRWSDIENALQSLQAQHHPADQIIFSVDNNPALFDAALTAFPTITVVQNEGSPGVSAARNVAARASSCDVLAYLDDDAVADPQWLAHLARWYDDPAVVGVGGTATPSWDGSAPSWFPPSFYWVVGCSHSGITDAAEPVRNFIGCNMSVRRTTWERVGGFDESIGRVGADGGGGDETDFCIRIAATGDGVIMHEPAARVTHRVPRSRQTVRYFVDRCLSEGRSKAQISGELGSDAALSEERKHLMGELPRSFGRGLIAAATGNLAGAKQSAAILLGTTATVFGYLRGRVRPSQRGGVGEPSFTPRAVVVVDLAAAKQQASCPTGEPAMVIVRRGTRVIGTRRIETCPSMTELVAELRRDFSEEADPERHLPSTAVEHTAAVVIATRDRPDSLERCLRSISALVHAPDQIIVVDNAPSSAATAELVQRWNQQNPDFSIEYVRCDTPGLARAHNASLPQVHTDVVAFTDDDVLVDAQWLSMLIDGFNVDPTIACVTGSIMPARLDTWAQDWVEATSNYTKGFASVLFSAAAPPEDPLFPFTAGSMGSGANMAFRTSWLVKHRFVDRLGAGTVALGGDDLRVFYDVIASNAAVFFTPDAMIFHHHHKTAKAIDRQAYGYGVGLGAYLTSVVLDRPSTIVAMLRQAPSALRHARAVTAPPTTSSYPGDSVRASLQRRGMATGPIRYLRSRG